MVMPEEDKNILKHNQNKKSSLKTSFVIDHRWRKMALPCGQKFIQVILKN